MFFCEIVLESSVNFKLFTKNNFARLIQGIIFNMSTLLQEGAFVTLPRPFKVLLELGMSVS